MLSVNGTSPFRTGFQIDKLIVELDNLTGLLTCTFDAALFYCGPNYDTNSNDLYLCPPETFKADIDGGGKCINCGDIDTVVIGG